jgi:protein-S-isoprenylcysteine O-methyltransferase Ste14
VPIVERYENLLLAGSVGSWAILGLTATAADSRWTVVRLSIALVQLTVAGLLLGRAPARRQASTSTLLGCLPALLVSAIVLRVAPDPHEWPLAAQLVFVVGAGVALSGMLALGRSFAVLPSLRRLVMRGPYGWIRHPAYAGQLLMMLGCAVAAWSWPAAGVLLFALAAVVARIVIEERFLAAAADYRAYTRRVPWRLVPYVW